MSHGIIDKLTGDKIATAGFEQADSALSATSEKPLQNKIINTELAKTYRDTDSTEITIADDDSFPFYDLSATAKKKTLWSNIVTTLGSTFSTITQLGKVSDKVSKSSDSYSDSIAYKVNDYVIYNDTLYRCKTACSAGSWSTNQSCFEVSSLTTAITSANSQISNLNSAVMDTQSLLNKGCTILITAGETKTFDYTYGGFVLINYGSESTQYVIYRFVSTSLGAIIGTGDWSFIKPTVAAKSSGGYTLTIESRANYSICIFMTIL